MILYYLYYIIYIIYGSFVGLCLSFPWSQTDFFKSNTTWCIVGVSRWDVQRPDVHFCFHHKQAGGPVSKGGCSTGPKREMLSNSQVGLGDPNTSGERCFYRSFEGVQSYLLKGWPWIPRVFHINLRLHTCNLYVLFYVFCVHPQFANAFWQSVWDTNSSWR